MSFFKVTLSLFTQLDQYLTFRMELWLGRHTGDIPAILHSTFGELIAGILVANTGTNIPKRSITYFDYQNGISGN